jgi:HD-GYP domain-containing protein (c-di-GMP phosphodiesterase class II)
MLVRGCGNWGHLSWTAQTRLCIGRMNTCEAVIDDSSVSRRHAEIAFTNQGWVIRDLGSTNGTLLNGVRLGRIDERLKVDDVIRTGDISLVVAELTEDTGPRSAVLEDGVLFQERAALQRAPRQGSELLAAPPTVADSRLIVAGQPSGVDAMESLLHATVCDAVQSMAAERGVIYLAEEKTSRLKPRVGFGRGDTSERDYHSELVAKRAFRQTKSLLCDKAAQDPRMATPNGAGSAAGGARSVICALLGTPAKPIGVLHLERDFAQTPFTKQDLHTADALAASISVGIESVQALVDKQRNFFMQTLLALAQAVDCRDSYTAGHTQRVTDYVLLLAEHLQVSSEDYHNLQIGTPLHDIGKIGIDDAVLRKSDQLSAEEFEHIKSHTVQGAAILEHIPQLAPVIPIVRNHHERWNGTGYPDGLAAEEIPHLARLVTVADVFDALTSDRPYRGAMSPDQAFDILKAGAGAHFDPEYTEAFLSLRPHLQQMLRERGAFTETVSRQELNRIMESLKHVPGVLDPSSLRTQRRPVHDKV